MRKLVQFFLIAIMASLLTTKTLAQLPKALVFGNFTYANPQGSLSSSYSNGSGFEIGGGIGFGKSILYGSTGYVTYTAKSGTPGDLKVIPVKLGLRRYLLFGLFVNAAVGLANQSYIVNSSYGQAPKAINESGFLYEAGAGIKILHVIEIGADYTGWSHNGSNVNALLLKAGLAIKL